MAMAKAIVQRFDQESFCQVPVPYDRRPSWSNVSLDKDLCGWNIVPDQDIRGRNVVPDKDFHGRNVALLQSALPYEMLDITTDIFEYMYNNTKNSTFSISHAITHVWHHYFLDYISLDFMRKY